MSAQHLDTTHDGRVPPDVVSNYSFAATREGLGGTMMSQPKTLSDGWTTQGWQDDFGSPITSPPVVSHPADSSFARDTPPEEIDLAPSVHTVNTVPVGIGSSGTHKLPELNLDMVRRTPVSPASSANPGVHRVLMRRRFEIYKDSDGLVGFKFRGPIVTDVVPGSGAEAAGAEVGLRIVSINDACVPLNMGSYEVQQLLRNSPSTVRITMMSVADDEENLINFGTWSSGDDSSIDLDESFQLSAQQAACSVVALIFIVTPLLVLLMSVFAGALLSVMLDWPFEDSFWVCGSVVVTPLGGAPVLKYEDHVNTGGRIFIAVLGAWSVGLLGVMQLMLAPGIGPLFAWTMEMKNKMSDEPRSPLSPQVRAMSAWRLRPASPSTASPVSRVHTARGLRRPHSSRAVTRQWTRRPSMSRLNRPPDTARSVRSIRSARSPLSPGRSDVEFDDDLLASTATGDAL